MAEIVIGVLGVLLIWEKVQHIVEARRWAGERKDLLNRLMARNFGEYEAAEIRNATADEHESGEWENGRMGEEARGREEDMEAVRAEEESMRILASKAETGYQAFVGGR